MLFSLDLQTLKLHAKAAGLLEIRLRSDGEETFEIDVVQASTHISRWLLLTSGGYVIMRPSSVLCLGGCVCPA